MFQQILCTFIYHIKYTAICITGGGGWGQGNYHYSTQLSVRKVGIKHKYENYRIEVRWYRAGVIPCDILVPHIDSRVNN